jgi:hypothetical protein
MKRKAASGTLMVKGSKVALDLGAATKEFIPFVSAEVARALSEKAVMETEVGMPCKQTTRPKRRL